MHIFFLNITLFLVYSMLENTLYLVCHVIIKGTEEQEDDERGSDKENN